MNDFGNDRIELVPQDDGAVGHLLGMEVPRIALQARDGMQFHVRGDVHRNPARSAIISRN